MHLVELYQAKKENEELQLGKKVIPHQFHEHEVHLNIHLQELNPSEELLTHIKIHKMFLELDNV